MDNRQLLYEEVVQITRAYLGPAADRFIDRQIYNHLHKKSRNLSEEELYALIDWIGATVSLLTEESRVVEQYTEQLKKLAMKRRIK